MMDLEVEAMDPDFLTEQPTPERIRVAGRVQSGPTFETHEQRKP